MGSRDWIGARSTGTAAGLGTDRMQAGDQAFEARPGIWVRPPLQASSSGLNVSRGRAP